MKKLKVASLLLCAGLFLAGCGDGGGSPEGPESEGNQVFRGWRCYILLPHHLEMSRKS